MNGAIIGLVIHILIESALILRVLLRPHRQPASRIAWIAGIGTLPVVGILAYILFGEVNIGRRRVARMREVLDELPPLASAVVGDESFMKSFENWLPPRWLRRILARHFNPQHWCMKRTFV